MKELHGTTAARTCPLNRVRAGTAVQIKELTGAHEINRRLREIGFCEQQTVRLLSCQATVICMISNARLAISSRLAETILVEPVVLTA